MSTLAEALMGTNISYATSSQPSGGNEPQNFSDPATGKAAHDKFEDELVRQTNTRKGDWFMRTARGVNGVDATYRGPVGRNPGFKYAELKPYSQNGYDTFQKQMDNWRLPEGKTQLWFYDQQGNIFSSGINY
jgi:hypothetical protein